MKEKLPAGDIPKILDIPLRERVYDSIKNLILQNKLFPGQVIVIDRLAEVLGVSQTPIREALGMLELDGLVSTSQYRNPRVVNIETKDVEELYDMRLLVEPWAIQHSIDHISIEQIEEVEKSLQTAYSEAANKNFAPHLESDIRLHRMILSSTGNAFFWQLASRVHDRSIRIRSLVEVTGDAQEILRIIEEHFQIVAAMKQQDHSLASQYLNKHLVDGKVRTLAALKRLPKAEE